MLPVGIVQLGVQVRRPRVYATLKQDASMHCVGVGQEGKS